MMSITTQISILNTGNKQVGITPMKPTNHSLTMYTLYMNMYLLILCISYLQYEINNQGLKK